MYLNKQAQEDRRFIIFVSHMTHNKKKGVGLEIVAVITLFQTFQFWNFPFTVLHLDLNVSNMGDPGVFN